MKKLFITRSHRLWLMVSGIILIVFAIVMNYVLEGYELSNWITLGYPSALCALVLFGICCIVVSLWPRVYKQYKLDLIIYASLTLGIYFFLYISAWIVDIDWNKDYDCSALYRVATAQKIIPHSVSAPNHFAMFCGNGQQGLFRTRYQGVIIYGVVDPIKQNKVIGELTNFHIKNHSLPIRIYFYEAENWITWNNPSNGASGATRGPERLIRVVIIR